MESVFLVRFRQDAGMRRVGRDSFRVRNHQLQDILVPVLALLAIFFSTSAAFGFHQGGVGYCEGCHALHKARDAQASGADAGAGEWMIKGADPSSTCLRCHAMKGESYRILSDDGSTFTPGGDFYWLKKSFSWGDDGRVFLSPGESHGHNIVAEEYGLAADARLNSAPGGIYPASALRCTSCHDPHAMRSPSQKSRGPISVSGSYGAKPGSGEAAGSYRLLAGVGYDGGGQGSGAPFIYAAPIAVADPDHPFETDSAHPAYGSGMSEWCANCHTGYLNAGGGRGGMGHPAGNGVKLRKDITSNYNAYVKTGDMTGKQDTAYLALVPFELGSESAAGLDPSGRSGPSPGEGANVMCLSCHRAHASAFQGMGRWDFRATFAADSHPRTGDSGASGGDVRHSYYGRDIAADFGRYQRQLCNKCHAAD